MKNIFLLIDGEARVSLTDFVDVCAEVNDAEPLNEDDIKAIESLKIGESHMVEQPDGDRCEVTRIEGPVDPLFEHVKNIVRVTNKVLYNV